jgi:hypothetical protein
MLQLLLVLLLVLLLLELLLLLQNRWYARNRASIAVIESKNGCNERKAWSN